MAINLRQVRYHVHTDNGEQIVLRHLWTVCIINAPREVGRIKEKMIAELAPADDYSELSEGLISGTEGLHYLAYSVSSGRGDLRADQWRKIYDAPGQVHEDRDLGSIVSPADVWIPERYIPRILDK